MSFNRRDFFRTSALAASLSGLPRTSANSELRGSEIAHRHQIVRNLPTPEFFEGMLLGNGDIGVCITVRPDALGLHIGKSDSWDIRVSEEHYSHVLPFSDLLKMWESASAEAKRQGKPDMLYLEQEIPFFREYTNKVTASYSKSWPRPWPCGILWVHWDATRCRTVRQVLDPSCGHYRLDLEVAGKPVSLHSFVNTATGHICLWSDRAAEFLSVVYYPNLDPDAHLPAPEIDGTASNEAAEFSGYQLFPAIAPTALVPNPAASDKDSNFAMHGVLRGKWEIEGLAEAQRMLRQTQSATDAYTSYEERPRVFLRSATSQALRIDVALFTPRDHANNVAYAASEVRRLSKIPISKIQETSDQYWSDLWSRSAVEFEDKELERWWYHNQYWLACCLRKDKIAPGLFGNWSSGKIGTAWHGDYHMNYNTQQVFWGVFSSNHVDQHLPYVDVVENLLPMSEKYAREKFGLPGAYFPHSAYPVPSQVVPYPAPPWGYEICETPWVVQSLWWHYLYTLDDAVLRRVYPLLKAAAEFMAAYMKRGEDGRYHANPTVSPENWGCTVDFRLNQDCIMDLALIDFLLEAVIKGSEILNVDQEQRNVWSRIRSNLPPYPRASGSHGEVWIDVLHAPVGWVYNIPVTLAPVFPGERVGLGSSEEELKIARRTAQTIRLEGGNDVIYQPLIRARLGMLDLQWFKQEVRYCLMPNGIVQDRVRQVGGRYKDSTNFDFMMQMGVWTENLSLPAVLNECLLQSYSGTLRLFPNTMNLGPARFRNLRAAGAFLVSAAWDGKTVSPVELLSERGATARVVNPWGKAKIQVTSLGDKRAVAVRYSGDAFEFATRAGERYRVQAAA
ncbi:MAG: glycosyl hydrolase family 95 catalytic domain-containing protein [Bryobacteraceae bacterium]